MRTLLITALLACPCLAQWPVPKSAGDAAEFVNQRRDQAEAYWSKGDPHGIAMLDELLRYLNQPLLRDLAAGSSYLSSRHSNIYLDYAEAYAIQGKRREALDYLHKMAALSQETGMSKGIEGLKNLESLRGDPEFRTVLSEFKRYEQFWDTKAIDTPFHPTLSDAEKIAGLSKFWSEVKYNFGYPEKLVELDWDNLYMQWIPKVLAAQTTEAYYREMMRLCARLADGHTNVTPPGQLDIAAKPPLRTGMVEGHLMILDVLSPALEAQGVQRGMEIVTVDGKPAAVYARDEVEPFVSSSTPQDRENRTFWYSFLRGPSTAPVRLGLMDASGKEMELSLARKGYRDIRPQPAVESRMLSGGVAYVALNSFGSDEVVKKWRDAFPKLAAAAALILDVRVNGGGSSEYGYEVIRDLVEKPFLGSRAVVRSYHPTERARGVLMDWEEFPADEVTPHDGPHFTKPVVVLAGPATFSAAEDFLVAWKNSARGPIIGEPSGGSTGQPLPFALPGGGSARVCTKRDTFPDGTVWVGEGIQPDIVVRPTVADVRAGRDAVIERALTYLKTPK